MGDETPATVDPVRERLHRQRARLQELRDQARERYSGGAPALQVAALICDTTDRLIVELFQESLRPLNESARKQTAQNAAVVAIGGTGRGELAPYSDVDLLFLYSSRCPKQFEEAVGQMVRDCWDAGIKLGHSVRTPADAVATALADPQFATALVEARLLWGDERLFQNFRNRFYRRVVRNRSTAFYNACLAARKAERAQHGATERQLEPDVKRSPGGLRDIHLLRWIGYARYGTTEIDLLRLEGALSREDALTLTTAQEFLTAVRVDLHFAAGKAQEILTREEQLRLADLHAYPAAEGQRPVERFMQAYFRHSSAIADIVSRFVALHRPRTWQSRLAHLLFSHRSNHVFRVGADEIDVIPRFRNQVCNDLDQLLNLYELAGLYSVRLTPELEEQVRLAVPNLKKTVGPSETAMFLSILRQTGQVGRLLRGMYKVGLLELLIPEMSHARCLLQFNQYHSYTVDEHSLRAVEAAEGFESDPGPVGVAYRKIKHKDILHLALLLHDLGKGFVEDHSAVGERLAARVAARLGLTASQTEMLVFLVHKHLTMAHLAFRRDLTDLEMLVRFSRVVGSPELLRMLFVLTASDMTAVGPGVWTDWKAELLTELFDRTLTIVSGAQPGHRETERIQRIREQVRDRLRIATAPNGQPEGPAGIESRGTEPLLNQRTVAEWMETCPLHYLNFTDPQQIATDLRQVAGLNDADISVCGTYEASTGTVEYRVYTKDTVGSGLFSRITGALTAKGLGILSANICTTTEGWVIDGFRVLDGDYAGIIPEYRLREVETALCDVIAGRSTVENLFQKHRRFTSRASLLHLAPEPTRVVIDNDSSERFTVIDVFAHDRRGLLYTIARTLLELDLSVSLAKIATHLDQVLDVFYVTDREGGKLQDEQRLQKIREALVSQIEQFEQRETVAAAV